MIYYRLASPTPQQEQKQSLEFRKHEGLAAQMAETLALRNEYNKYHPYPDASTFRSYLTDVDGLDNGFIKRRDSSSDADDGASNSSPSSHGYVLVLGIYNIFFGINGFLL